MKSKAPRPVCFLAFAFALAHAMSQAAPPSDSAPTRKKSASQARQITAVENGLVPPILVKGEPRPNWSITERMAHYKVPGVSIAVTVDRDTAWAKGYGVLDASGSKPVDSESLFQAASISKPVNAAAALRLVEQGKLRLDAPVNDQLERWKIPDNEYTAKQSVTLRHLLSHRAGTTVHGFPGYAKTAAIPTLIEVLNGQSPANTRAVVVDKMPGESFRYSGGGTTIVQLLIEDVTDQSYERFMSAQVLAPLGMMRSHFRHPIVDTNAARAHVDENSTPLAGHSHTYPELAAAGLWTTPTDLSTFALKIVDSLQGMEGAFLSAAITREMLAPLDDDYGLGFGIVETNDGIAFGHNGGNHGFKCRLFTYIDGRGGFAIMTNADSGSPLIREIAGAIAATYGWELDAARELEAVTLSSDAMQAIAGSYYLNPDDEGSRIQIGVADNTMWVEAPFFARTRLYSASDTSFFITAGHEIELEKDASGRPTAILIKGGPRAIRRE